MTEPEFNRIVTRYGNRVYGYVVYYLGSSDQAHDVLQEVFIRLWKRRREVEPDRVLSWLLTVARNACIDEHRKNKNRISRMTTDTDIVEAALDGGGRSPSDITESSMMMEDIQRAVDNLEDPYRSIVILREMQGFKYDEIADALELPLSTVKVYLHRARKKLRHQLMDKLELRHVG